VVCQPDRPRGRGLALEAPAVKRVAEAHGVPVLQPQKVRDGAFLEALRAWAPDLVVVAAYGRILPQRLLDVPRLGMINVHASLLPRWRGAAPVHRAVMAGDRTTGVTIMRVVLALDAGPMLAANCWSKSSIGCRPGRSARRLKTKRS
jgi:methionyl-tRNA formyltransferase